MALSDAEPYSPVVEADPSVPIQADPVPAERPGGRRKPRHRDVLQRLRGLAREAGKFLVVGGFGYVTDVVLYNLLVHVPPGDGMLHDKPLTAKGLSLFAATIVTFVGNRQWTFRHRRGGGIPRQYAIFLGLNVVAAAITLAPLAVSRYLLSYNSPLADNIAGSVIGVTLALVFRFLTYRRWVFNGEPVRVVAYGPT